MFERGKIILVPFPFTDLSSQKVRPAIIISEPTRVKEHVIVAFVTSKPTATSSKGWITVTQRSKEFGDSGLKQTSLIRCDKIATLDKKIVLGEIGKLPSTIMRNVDSALRFTLGLK